ncbi:MAG: SGNH/GDSL hydrolase family protein [Chloroflexi bacterium]|nr:MAG: SGNH/GDSL hydrolase family protein [Chloroflexota bacterium]
MKTVVRLLLVLLPLALLAGMVPASANDEGGYLALGDSVAFGFSPLVLNPTDTDAYVGYPEVLSKHEVNASCSGETSGSLIAGPPDNGCAAFRSVAPLHVSYTGTQLAFAVAYIRAHPDTELLTIDIGANDLFILLRTCAGSSSCFAAGFPALLSRLGSNLATIYGSLRAAGFTGHLVALTYYLTNYNDANAAAAIGAINSVVMNVTTAFGGRVADGFGAFKAEAAEAGGDSCLAGLLIQLPTGGCDIHPSKMGQKVLARAIEAVD